MKTSPQTYLQALVSCAVALVVGCANGPEKPRPPLEPPSSASPVAVFTLGDMEKLRVQSEFYARKVRQFLPPKSGEALECEKRYAFSQAAVNGAIVDLQNLVLAGRDPAENSDFCTKAAASREEVNGFINYADAELLKVVSPEARVTSRSPSGEVSERVFPLGLVGLDVIAGLGNWAWKQISEARKVGTAKAEEAAKRLASGFDKQRWRDFEDIVGGKK